MGSHTEAKQKRFAADARRCTRMLRADPICCGSLKLSRIQPALSPPPRFGCGRPRCVHLLASAQDLFVAARNTNSRGISEAIGSLSQERGVTQMQADGRQCTQISPTDPDPLPLASCARGLRYRVRNLVAANSRAAFNCTANPQYPRVLSEGPRRARSEPSDWRLDRLDDNISTVDRGLASAPRLGKAVPRGPRPSPGPASALPPRESKLHRHARAPPRCPVRLKPASAWYLQSPNRAA